MFQFAPTTRSGDQFRWAPAAIAITVHLAFGYALLTGAKTQKAAEQPMAAIESYTVPSKGPDAPLDPHPTEIVSRAPPIESVQDVRPVTKSIEPSPGLMGGEAFFSRAEPVLPACPDAYTQQCNCASNERHDELHIICANDATETSRPRI